MLAENSFGHQFFLLTLPLLTRFGQVDMCSQWEVGNNYSYLSLRLGHIGFEYLGVLEKNWHTLIHVRKLAGLGQLVALANFAFMHMGTFRLLVVSVLLFQPRPMFL